MPKDTFYFSHDYAARSDTKIKKLIFKHGMTGYGIYWAIVEDLYNNANALPTDYELISHELRCDLALIKSVINDFGLFIVYEDIFLSSSIGERLERRILKSEKASESANKRWEKERNMQTHKNKNKNAMRTHSDSNAIKENKVKESKERDKIAPDLSNSNLYRKPVIPTKEDVEMSFIQNGGTKEMAERFYDKYDSTNWYKNGSPISNYRPLVYSFVTNWKKNNKNETNLTDVSVARKLEEEKTNRILGIR